MVSKDNLKKGVAGAVVLLVAAVTLAIVLMTKRSGKTTKTTGQQTKELEEDRCEKLFKEYENAEKNGLAWEQLKPLYYKGRAECPSVFPLIKQPQEVPKLEDIRARLVKKQEEQNAAEGGKTVQGSKGKDNAADPSSKPATVPKAKNNPTGIKISTEQTTDKTKVEVKSVVGKTPQQPQVPSPNAKQPNDSLKEFYEKLENKNPEFETAFATLQKDKNLEMMLVIDAMYKLQKPEDQIALLETVQRLKPNKNEESDRVLINVLISAINKKPVESKMSLYLVLADFKLPQKLAAITEAIERIRKSGGTALEHATLDFYKVFASLAQGLVGRFDEKIENVTLLDKLHGVAGYSPFDIEAVGRALSKANIGAEGTLLVEQSALCIQKRSESEPANEKYQKEHGFAQGFLKIYKSVKGENIRELSDQIAVLGASFM